MEQQNFNQPVQPLPNATPTLVLGICSIVGCFLYGIIGLACGIVAIAISNKSVKMYQENPSMYSGYQNLKAGRVCAIVGISLSALYLLFIVIFGSMFWSTLMGLNALNQ